MERYSIYKVNRGLAYFLLIFGILLLLLGISLLIISFSEGFNTEFPRGNWQAVFSTLQGSLFILMSYYNLRSGKYYIEWDENSIRYFLPATKGIEILSISDINEVTISLFEIQVTTSDAKKRINLEHVQFKEIRRIKEKFEEIRISALSRNNS